MRSYRKQESDKTEMNTKVVAIISQCASATGNSPKAEREAQPVTTSRVPKNRILIYMLPNPSTNPAQWTLLSPFHSGRNRPCVKSSDFCYLGPSGSDGEQSWRDVRKGDTVT